MAKAYYMLPTPKSHINRCTAVNGWRNVSHDSGVTSVLAPNDCNMLVEPGDSDIVPSLYDAARIDVDSERLQSIRKRELNHAFGILTSFDVDVTSTTEICWPQLPTTKPYRPLESPATAST